MADAENDDYCVICKHVENWESQAADDALIIIKKKPFRMYVLFHLKLGKMDCIIALKTKHLSKCIINVI